MNPGPPAYADYVLEALAAWRREGLGTALLTIVATDGGSPRPLGSQMAVAQDGRALGAISGGCLERSLVLEAIDAIERQCSRTVLYGAGSKYVDLVLPCGSSLHVHFDVTLSDAELDRLVAARRRRRPSAYTCEGPGGPFQRVYEPQPRALIMGQGPILLSLGAFLVATEFEVHVATPDGATFEQGLSGAQVRGLRGAWDWDEGLLDGASALISLFHDHDHEVEIFDRALRSPAFYLGALGSRRTHALRLERLADRGWTDEDLRRVHGPVGLDLGAQTPPEIALSIGAQLVAARRGRSTIRAPAPRDR